MAPPGKPHKLADWAAANPEATAILESATAHNTVAGLLSEITGTRFSEASVRRWRAARGWILPPAPTLDAAPELEAQSARYGQLRRAHDATLRQLAAARVKNQELVAAVYEAASAAALALDVPAVPKPPPDRRRKSPEVAVAVLADWQLAKVTSSYSSLVCEQRIEAFAAKVASITATQRADHPVRECHVWMLGDLVEGELIFPGQSYAIDASLYRQVTVDGPRILGNFVRSMAALFDKVTVHAVIGNHGAIGGRSRRDMDPETNADRMVYRITQQLLAREPRISWVIPDGPRERNWYSVARIGAYSALLFHGDQLVGHSGFPWYSLSKKVGGWRLGAVEEAFQDVYFGHWHQPTRVTLNNCTARCAGSTESHNAYAQERLSAVGQPSQPLMFVNPAAGRVTAEYCVWL